MNPKNSNSGSVSTSLIWPLRLFMGSTFVYAGVQHLTDPSYFDPSKSGYIGHLISQYAVGSPIHGFLLGVVAPNAVSFGWMVAVGEILIGVATLFGVAFRFAAFFGLVLNFMFFLSATWNAFPFYFGSDIVFVMCWLTLLLTGPHPGLSVDGLLAKRYPSLSWLLPKMSLVNSIGTAPKQNRTVISETDPQPLISSQAKLYPKQVREINRAFDQIKKQFILHRETQTALEFMRALVISLGVDRNDTVRILGMLQNIVTRKQTGGATTRIGGSVVQ